MNNFKSLAVLAAFIGLTSCATYVPFGSLYSGGTTGMSANNNVKPIKEGRACVMSVLGLVAAGDGSISSAKSNGGITKVASVDYEVFNVLGVYGNYCTVIKGE